MGKKFEQTLHKEDTQATKNKKQEKSVQYNKKEREKLFETLCAEGPSV